MRRIQISVVKHPLNVLFSVNAQQLKSLYCRVCLTTTVFYCRSAERKTSVCMPATWVHSGRLQPSVFSLLSAGGVSFHGTAGWWKQPIKSRRWHKSCRLSFIGLREKDPVKTHYTLKLLILSPLHLVSFPSHLFYTLLSSVHCRPLAFPVPCLLFPIPPPLLFTFPSHLYSSLHTFPLS